MAHIWYKIEVYFFYIHMCMHSIYFCHELSIDWRVIEDHFQSFCNVLPHNYQLTIDKLKTISQLLKDGGEQLSKLISSSSSADVRKINEKIVTYLIVKLCYNDSDTSLVTLCGVMDESIDSTDIPTGMQQTRYCEYMYVRTTCLIQMRNMIKNMYNGLFIYVICMLNKNTLGVKKCETNQKQRVSRQMRPKALISAEAKKLLHQKYF